MLPWQCAPAANVMKRGETSLFYFLVLKEDHRIFTLIAIWNKHDRLLHSTAKLRLH